MKKAGKKNIPIGKMIKLLEEMMAAGHTTIDKMYNTKDRATKEETITLISTHKDGQFKGMIRDGDVSYEKTVSQKESI